MKKLLLFYFLGFLFSCSDNQKIKDGIDSYLCSKTMGVKIDFNYKDIKLIEKFTVNEVIIDYYKIFEFPKDKALNMVVKDVERLANEVIESEPNDPSAIVWKFKSDRISELSKKAKTDIEYYIVKTTYNFKNPILNNAEVELTKYFILNSDNKVIAAIDEEDFINRQKEYNKTPLMKYELSILSERDNIEL